MSKVSIQGDASGTGTLTIAAPNTNSNYTLTLPTETGTIITKDGSNDVTLNDITAGGIYLGGTGAANYLDDYEEGTWTPVVTGGTTAGSASYSVQDGLYVKIGSMVYFRLTVTYTGHTGTGSIGITGIPFSVASGINIFSFACDNFTFPSDTTFAYIGGGASKIDIRYMNSGSSSSAVAMDAAANIYISGSYPTS